MQPGATLAELDELAERRHSDPIRALRRAEALLEASDEPRVEATAHWVIGLTLHELGRPVDAVDSYRRSVTIAAANGLAEEEALARAAMAQSLVCSSDTARADREMAQARAGAPESVRGVVEMLYGVVCFRAGRLDEALRSYRRSLRLLERARDLTSIARLRLNRGNSLAYQGFFDAALEDLAEAERLATAQGLPILAAMAAHNTGFAHCRRGSFPDALASFDRAEAAYAGAGGPARLVAVLLADRCEVLLLAGLVAEARATATDALAALSPTGDSAHIMEVRLLLARTMLAGGAYEEAAAEASAAASRFSAAHRLPWAAQARYVAIRAEVLASEDRKVPPPDLLRRGRRIAAELDSQGWPVEAVHVRTFVGRMALALGRQGVARTELGQAAVAVGRGPAALRVQAWHAAALLRLADGDVAASKRALRRGMAVVDDYRASLGATELRANAAGHGADLARLGMSLALQDGRPAEVLRWAERWRAGALRRPAARPPDDPQLGADLAELRRIRSELRERGLPRASFAALQQEASGLEEAIRQRTLKAKGGTMAETGQVDVAALRRAVGDRALVEYIAFGERLHAVTVHRGRVRLYELGPTSEVEREKQYLQFALRRLLADRDRMEAAATSSSTASRLDDLLVSPLGLPPGIPLVVVPTGVLHGLAWASLPSLRRRAVTIAPSAAVWQGACARRPSGAGRVALVAGPGLPGADAEVRELAALYPGARALVGPGATVAAVLASMGETDLLHLAAHGTFRADSPLFSSVLLADGPLTVYDLERLDAVPATVVLPACHAGVPDVRVGDELVGTATALLGLGVSSVIAPVMAVPDEATAVFMIALHRLLREGRRPAAALSEAADGQDPMTAQAFVCIGCDDRDGGEAVSG